MENSPVAPDGVTILTEMTAWQMAHPTATLAELEAALDERLFALRRRLLATSIAHGADALWGQQPVEQRPVCPDCGTPLLPRGTYTRTISSAGGDVPTVPALPANAGFSPLMSAWRSCRGSSAPPSKKCWCV